MDAIKKEGVLTKPGKRTKKRKRRKTKYKPGKGRKDKPKTYRTTEIDKEKERQENDGIRKSKDSLIPGNIATYQKSSKRRIPDEIKVKGIENQGKENKGQRKQSIGK